VPDNCTLMPAFEICQKSSLSNARRNDEKVGRNGLAPRRQIIRTHLACSCSRAAMHATAGAFPKGHALAISSGLHQICTESAPSLHLPMNFTGQRSKYGREGVFPERHKKRFGICKLSIRRAESLHRSRARQTSHTDHKVSEQVYMIHKSNPLV
jgi:hypothetical protein